MKLLIVGAGPGGYETAVEAARRGIEVTIISKGTVGGASFVDAHTASVDGQTYSGDSVITATGSESASLPVPGAELEGVPASRELLELSEVSLSALRSSHFLI